MIRCVAAFLVGFLLAWLSPIWATGGFWTMNASGIMRLVAVVCFVLAMFGVAPGGVGMIPLGLALWCGSSFA